MPDSSKTLLRFCRRLAAVGPWSRPGEVASGVVVLVIGQWLRPQRWHCIQGGQQEKAQEAPRGAQGSCEGLSLSAGTNEVRAPWGSGKRMTTRPGATRWLHEGPGQPECHFRHFRQSPLKLRAVISIIFVGTCG